MYSVACFVIENNISFLNLIIGWVFRAFIRMTAARKGYMH